MVKTYTNHIISGDCGPNPNTFNCGMGNIVMDTNDYEKLYNLPSINGVALIGNLTSEQLKIFAQAQTYTFEQAVPDSEWIIEHGLNKFPSVTVVDSGGNVVIGEIYYIDKNSLRIEFSPGGFSGKAFLN